MKIKDHFKLREIAGEWVIILQGTHGIDLTKVIALNETARWLWNNLYGKEFTIEEAADLLQAHYNIDKTTAEYDVSRWIHSLSAHAIITES